MNKEWDLVLKSPNNNWLFRSRRDQISPYFEEVYRSDIGVIVERGRIVSRLNVGAISVLLNYEENVTKRNVDSLRKEVMIKERYVRNTLVQSEINYAMIREEPRYMESLYLDKALGSRGRSELEYSYKMFRFNPTKIEEIMRELT